MSLVSNLFLLFVAVSVLVYYIVPHKFQWLVLLCFSYIYYLAGGVRYVGFILFSTLVTWGIALAVEKAEAGGSHKSARNFLVLGLILNFGMLGVIKYTNFPHWLPGGLHLQLKRQRQVEATKVQEIFWCLD